MATLAVGSELDKVIKNVKDHDKILQEHKEFIDRYGEYVTVEIQRSAETNLHSAVIDGKTIGIFRRKWKAKSAIKKYLKEKYYIEVEYFKVIKIRD